MTIAHDVVMQDYKTDLWAETLSNPPEFRRQQVAGNLSREQITETERLALKLKS